MATPAKADEPLTKMEVALVDALYSRLLAVMPVTVSSLVVMLADVVGCVSE